MDFKNEYFGLRDFKDKEEIIKYVNKSKNFKKAPDENLNNARALQLYETKNQKSWLVRTNKRIYRILDDRRKNKPVINWSSKISEITDENNQIKMEIKDYKRNTGKIVFEHRPNKEYLYSKKLFINIAIELSFKYFMED